MRLSVLLFSLHLAAPAWADTPMEITPREIHPELLGADVEVIRGFYYIASSRPEYAVEIATRILQQDPTMISAHRTYIYGLLEMRQVDQVLSIYQDWHLLSPEDEIRRTALAWAWMARQDEPGAWCEEVNALTSNAPSTGATGYWQHRARLEASKKCYFDGQPSRAALMALGQEVEEAWGYRLRLVLAGQKEIDEAMSAEILSFGTAFPNRLAYIPNIWAKSYRGSGLTLTQEGLVALARTGAESIDPVEVYEAALVLGRAGLDEEQEAANAHLTALDPERAARKPIYVGPKRNRVFFTPSGSDRASAQELLVRNLVSTHQRRELIRALRTLDADLPRSGRARAAWYKARADAETDLGRTDEALESRRQQWISEPSGTIHKDLAANAYAWSAAVQGKDLERALEAIESALAGLPQWDPRDPQFLGRNYEEWLSLQRRRTGAWLDTKGWILYQLNRMDEARTALEQAMLIRPDPDPEILLHLGLVLATLQEEEEALHQLSRGLSLASPVDPLAIEAREVAEKLFTNRHWTGNQLEGWVQIHHPTRPNTIEEPEELQNYRVGKLFPDLVLKVDGKNQKLSDFQGIIVVDLWASWCGPCLRALPHMNALAEQYQTMDVTFLAVSVDDSPTDSKKPIRELGSLHLTNAWVGPDGMDQARVQGIPAVFILDADRKILAYVNGFQDGDTRIDAHLDSILGQPPASSTEDR